jgi:hypothetical protein
MEMDIKHFVVHLEANGCHLHKSNVHPNGTRFIFRRDDDLRLARGAFSLDGKMLKSASICFVCQELCIPAPKLYEKEDQILRAVKKMDFNVEEE